MSSRIDSDNLISTKAAEDALRNLSEALRIANPSDLERDGTIQRFEHCYEIMWKLARRILKQNEIEAEIPREVFRQLGRVGWIHNVEEWIAFQKSRNETSHYYGEKLAQKSYELSKVFLPLAKDLLTVFKSKG